MGTPVFSVPVLNALIEAGHQVAAVYTRAPRPAGRRGLDLTPSPVHLAAQQHDLPVETPKSLRSEEALATLRAYAPDVLVVVAYGLILPKAILDVPPFGALNLHASLLPRWRGAAPIQRAIMAGDSQSGIELMRMEEGLDTGPVGLVGEVTIGPDMTGGELHDLLSLRAATLIIEGLQKLEAGTLTFTPQTEDGVIYAKKIEKVEARIDWRRPAHEVYNLIRALSPFPGAFFEVDLGKGLERIKILRAELTHTPAAQPGEILDAGLSIACGEGEGSGAIKLLDIQRSGKAPMSAEAFLRGTKLPASTRLPLPDLHAPL
ncbi:methionyl-tRNA formyltransferase [Beijerinckia indica subsp. indica ATCC 9039]|uniref:Methionyl-tRNA formyltransferase n=2 Tax=Beijerinckia TaxID=532 RepID=B2IEV9_BEII9|nr:methionyl-tRNA formyltransferase [Beijerinckia indica subsp. indica ATCC 9039]